MNQIKEWVNRVRRKSLFSLLLGVAIYLLETFGGDYIVRKLGERGISIDNFLQWLLDDPIRAAVIAFLSALTILIVIDYILHIKEENKKITFLPRRDKPGLWDDYRTWLEIVADNEDTSDCYAVLGALEFSNNGMQVNCLDAVANSTAPRLQLSKGKISIASANHESVRIAFEDGYKQLPMAECFHIKVQLKKKNRVLAIFDGVLHFNYFGSEEVLWLEPV